MWLCLADYTPDIPDRVKEILATPSQEDFTESDHYLGIEFILITEKLKKKKKKNSTNRLIDRNSTQLN